MKKHLLVLYDKNNTELFNNSVQQLPVREDLINAKSIEFFNDEAPCFLHRSAVLQRLFAELDVYFGSLPAYENQPIECMPRDIADILRINERVTKAAYYR